jgi:hypothetical protein
MNPFPSRRPLADLIVEFADGISAILADTDSAHAPAIRPVSLECKLPVESVFSTYGNELTLLADIPSTRTRSRLDRPINGLSFSLGVEALP